MPKSAPLVLLILDGWGCAANGPGNAVCCANTPTLDRLQSEYPSTKVACSGREVGLPDGYMGNSEVGHMNIGAGRVVYQDMTRIDMSIEDGSFFENQVFVDACDKVKASGGKLHLMGLVSEGGVHSHENHIYALLALAQGQDVPETYVHAFLDGRDTPPASGLGYVEKLIGKMQKSGYGRVASVTGRYYAMDRDRRWDRNELAYNALTLGEGEKKSDPLEAIRQAYANGENDEFVRPRVIVGADGKPLATIDDGDAVIFFNFRADRARQISRCLFEDNFSDFDRKKQPELAVFATMTRYEASFPMPAAFPPVEITHTLGQSVSEAGLKQLRIAETEKYAHVTFFLNCGREEPFTNEDRVLIPSPREVATYDEKPEMSATEVTDKVVELWQNYDLTVCNLANLDMVGHTGIMDAAISACEVVDSCVGRIVDSVLASGGRIILTADHGNSEEMIDKSGEPQTAHSKNPVPFVYIAKDAASFFLRDGGRLGDIAPTALQLLGLEQPEDMTGKSLLL